MKQLLGMIGVIVVAACAPAHANERMAKITSVTPNYHTVPINSIETRCEEVQVPIYGEIQGGGASGGEVLGGMILGGLLGKGVAGDDKGAAVGAILGGIVAAEDGKKGEKVVTGYKVENRCYDVEVRDVQRVLKNYKITYTWNGISGSSYTYNYYNVGDRVPVSVSINAK